MHTTHNFLLLPPPLPSICSVSYSSAGKMDPDLELYYQLSAAPEGTVKIYARMAEARLGAVEQTEIRSLSKMFASKIPRLLGGAVSWSAPQLRRLETLVSEHARTETTDFPWGSWSTQFENKQGFQLRDKARVLFPDVFTRSHRCWYGIGTATRCNNSRENNKLVSFVVVPNIQKVHNTTTKTHAHTHTHTYTHNTIRS